MLVPGMARHLLEEEPWSPNGGRHWSPLNYDARITDDRFRLSFWNLTETYFCPIRVFVCCNLQE
jgi:hypothetical protein